MSSRKAVRKAVIVGVGQYRRNPKFDGPFEPWEPAAMMAEAIRRAVDDCGAQGDASASGIPATATLLACVDPIAWNYTELCTRVGELAAVNPAAEGLTVPPGGNSPGDLLIQLANRIVAGEADVALLAGSECVYGRRRAMKEQLTLGWTPTTGRRDFLKGQRPLANELESRHGIVAPVQCYPLFENALRAKAGRTVAGHQAFLGTFMARNAAVAAENPYAWFQVAYTPDEITTPTPGNRWVCFPYTKRMNAIMEVDLSAAVVVMSSDEADRRGIPKDKQVAFLGGGAAIDAWSPTERIDFTSSPAINAAAHAAFEHAGVGVDDIDVFDFYSCFPSAVEMALAELGIASDDPRGVTATGGLAYAGGPGNSYAMHGLAAVSERLRSNPGEKVGLVTALGMAATKHAYCVLSNDPTRIDKADGLGHKVTMPEAAVTGPELVDEVSGEGTIETYTVEYGRDGAPIRTCIVVRFDDGRRTVANGSCTDEEVRALTESEGIGRRVHVEGGKAGEGDANVPNRAGLIG
jgi:acetyl-CoA C-acetyltransferase